MATTSDQGDPDAVFDHSMAPTIIGRREASVLLLAGAVSSLLLGLLAFLGHGVAWHAVGYGLCSVVAFSLVATYRRQSLRRLFQVGIASTWSANAVAFGVLLVGFAASIAHAWFIASQLA